MTSYPMLLLRLCALAAMTMAAPLHAADITLIVPYVQGGPTSVMTTRLAEAMAATSGKTVEVRHNDAGGGVAAVQELASAAKDGSVFLVGDLNLILILRMASSPLDLVKDFEPAATIGSKPLAFVTSANGKIKSVQQARSALANGGTLASRGSNSIAGACAELLKTAMGQPAATIVPYRATAPMIMDVRSGQIDTACVEASPQTLQGMTILGITGPSAASTFQAVPTLVSQGVQVKLVSVTGLFAPKGTPVRVLDQTQNLVTAATSRPDLRSFLINQLMITPE